MFRISAWINPKTYVDESGYAFVFGENSIEVIPPASTLADLPFSSDFPCGWDERDAKV